MPTYTYRCRKCEHAFEEFHSMSDTKPRKCPKCGAPRAQRVPAGGGGLLFKGTGFYITDYRSKSYKESARKDSTSGSGGDGGGSKSGKSGDAGGGGKSGDGGSGKGSKGSSGKSGGE